MRANPARWILRAGGVVVLLCALCAALPAHAQSSLTSTLSSTAAADGSATSVALSSPTTLECNGDLLNGFLIMHNNELPNAACPPQQQQTAAGPTITYGLNLPNGEYRLASGGHPANLPGTTTMTYLPTSGVAEGEGFITVSVTTTYTKPATVNIPPGGDADSWTEATYLPSPGIAGTFAGQSTAEWFGPGGLYTISTDSAHSSLTLKQAAALLRPVTVVEQAAPSPPPSGNGAVVTKGATRRDVSLSLGLAGAVLAALGGSLFAMTKPRRG